MRNPSGRAEIIESALSLPPIEASFSPLPYDHGAAVPAGHRHCMHIPGRLSADPEPSSFEVAAMGAQAFESEEGPRTWPGRVFLSADSVQPETSPSGLRGLSNASMSITHPEKDQKQDNNCIGP